MLGDHLGILPDTSELKTKDSCHTVVFSEIARGIFECCIEHFGCRGHLHLSLPHGAQVDADNAEDSQVFKKLLVLWQLGRSMSREVVGQPALHDLDCP